MQYDKETGVFHWKINLRRTRIGDIAGCDSCYGYWQIKVDRRLYGAHRLAWLYVYGIFPENYIDHIDAIRSNNAISNLRECSNRQNLMGVARHKDNSSGFKGVSRKRLKWSAQIYLDNRHVRLGVFNFPQDAARAYDTAALEHFGEFARTNKMLGLLP